MNKAIAYFLVMLVVVGCATKAEKARTNIAQTWKISKVFQNGADVTTTYTETRENYRISFTNGGTFQESYLVSTGGNQVNISGSWVFSDGIRKVTLTDGNQTRVYEVDLLDENNFNITDLGSTNNREIQFIPE
jgi:hypothetical protein